MMRMYERMVLDKSVYPLIGLVSSAVLGDCGFLFWKAVSSPDVRFNKTERVHQIIRKHT